MPSPNKIKVLIVEDYTKIAEAWREILTQKGYDVVAICSGETEAINQSTVLNPDIVLMDINLKEGNGFTCTKMLKSLLPQCKVIALSMFNSQNHLENMLDAGAFGYVTKNSSVKEILNAIEVVYGGGTYICADMSEV